MTIGEDMRLPALLTLAEAGEAVGLTRANVYRAVAVDKSPVLAVEAKRPEKGPDSGAAALPGAAGTGS